MGYADTALEYDSCNAIPYASECARRGEVMYERIDVPKKSIHRSVIAVLVLIAVAAALAVLIPWLWQRANEHSKLGDSKLSKAVSAATVAQTSIQGLADGAGVVPTGDSISTVLFALVSDTDEHALTDIKFIALNETKKTGTLVDMPADTYLAQSPSKSFTQWFSAGGAASVVKQLSSSGSVPITHVVVMRESGWDTFMSSARKGTSSVMQNAQPILDALLHSDMNTKDLLSVGQNAASRGLAKGQSASLPTQEVTNSSGTHQEISAVDLGLALGTLARP